MQGAISAIASKCNCSSLNHSTYYFCKICLGFTLVYYYFQSNPHRGCAIFASNRPAFIKVSTKLLRDFRCLSLIRLADLGFTLIALISLYKCFSLKKWPKSLELKDTWLNTGTWIWGPDPACTGISMSLLTFMNFGWGFIKHLVTQGCRLLSSFRDASTVWLWAWHREFGSWEWMNDWADFRQSLAPCLSLWCPLMYILWVHLRWKVYGLKGSQSSAFRRVCCAFSKAQKLVFKWIFMFTHMQ